MLDGLRVRDAFALHTSARSKYPRLAWQPPILLTDLFTNHGCDTESGGDY